MWLPNPSAFSLSAAGVPPRSRSHVVVLQGPGLSHWRLWRAHVSVASSPVPFLLTSLLHTLFSLLPPLFLAPPAVCHPGLLLQVACLISQPGGMDPAGEVPVPWHHCCLSTPSLPAQLQPCAPSHWPLAPSHGAGHPNSRSATSLDGADPPPAFPSLSPNLPSSEDKAAWVTGFLSTERPFSGSLGHAKSPWEQVLDQEVRPASWLPALGTAGSRDDTGPRQEAAWLPVVNRMLGLLAKALVFTAFLGFCLFNRRQRAVHVLHC